MFKRFGVLGGVITLFVSTVPMFIAPSASQAQGGPELKSTDAITIRHDQGNIESLLLAGKELFHSVEHLEGTKSNAYTRPYHVSVDELSSIEKYEGLYPDPVKTGGSGDFDGDGKTDAFLVVGEGTNGDEIRFLWNQAEGFTSRSGIATGAPIASAFAVTDEENEDYVVVVTEDAAYELTCDGERDCSLSSTALVTAANGHRFVSAHYTPFRLPEANTTTNSELFLPLDERAPAAFLSIGESVNEYKVYYNFLQEFDPSDSEYDGTFISTTTLGHDPVDGMLRITGDASDFQVLTRILVPAGGNAETVVTRAEGRRAGDPTIVKSEIDTVGDTEDVCEDNFRAADVGMVGPNVVACAELANFGAAIRFVSAQAGHPIGSGDPDDNPQRADTTEDVVPLPAGYIALGQPLFELSYPCRWLHVNDDLADKPCGEFDHDAVAMTAYVRVKSHPSGAKWVLRVTRAYNHGRKNDEDVSSPWETNWLLGEPHNEFTQLSEEQWTGTGDSFVRIPLTFNPFTVKWKPESTKPTADPQQTNPVILAVMAAPPRVKGAQQDPAALPEFNKTSTEGSGTTTSTSTRVRAMLGFDAEVEVGVKALSMGGGFEATLESEVTESTSVSKQVEISDSFFGGLDDHTVVYQTTELYKFKGTIEESSNGMLKGKSLYVYLPGATFVTKSPLGSFVNNPDWGGAYDEGTKLHESLKQLLPEIPGNLKTYRSFNPSVNGDPGGARDYCLSDTTHRASPPTSGDWSFWSPPPNPFKDPAIPERLGEPKILLSAIHSVDAADNIAGGEGASITFEQGSEQSFLHTNSFDMDVYLQAAGVKGGGGFGFTWGKEWTSSWAEGTGFSGFIGDIPSSELTDEQYKWKMFVCKVPFSVPGTGGFPGSTAEIWAQNWLVADYIGSGGLVDVVPAELVSPINSARATDGTFRWRQDGTVKSYTIELEAVGAEDHREVAGPSYETTSDAASRPTEVDFTPDLEVPLLDGELYRWRVKATDYFNSETVSPWAFFREPSAPDGHIRFDVPRQDGDSRLPIVSDDITFSVDVTDDGGGDVTSWDWNFGDGNTSDSAVPTHRYGVAGTYPVTVTIGNPFGERTISSSMTVADPSPVADFRFVGLYASRDPDCNTWSQARASTAHNVCFKDLSTDDLAPPAAFQRHQWNFGDGATSTEREPVHRYAQPGIYPVTFFISSNHGDRIFTSEITRHVRVEDGSPSPEFTFEPLRPTTEDEVRFDSSASSDPFPSASLEYRWDFGDGSTWESTDGSTLPPPHRYSEPGTYDVTLWVGNDAGLASEITKTIAVGDPSPIPDYTYSPKAPSTAVDVEFAGVFDDALPDGALYEYAWDFGDGMVGAGPAPRHRYGDSGNYPVTLTVTGTYEGRTYKGTITRSLYVEDGSPAADFGFEPLRPSTADTISFEDLSTDPDPDSTLDAFWDFGDGTSATGPAPNHRYAEPGAYEVTLTVENAGGLTSEIRRTVSVSDGRPHVSLRWSPTEVSTADEVELISTTIDPGSRPLRYEWKIDGQEVGGDRQSVDGVQFEEPGTHEVQLTATNDAGLSGQVTRTLYVTDGSPFVDVYTAGGFTSAPTEFRDLSADPGDRDLAYRWNWGDGSPDTVWGFGERPADRVARHLYSQPGTYTVMLTLTNDAGLETSKIFFVEIQDGTPRADFLISPESATTSIFVRPQDRSVDPAGLELSYRWDFGDGTTSTERYPSHDYAEPGVFVIELTVRNPAGQSHTVSRKVRVEPGNPMADFTWDPTHPLTLDEVAFTSNSRDPAGLPLSYEWDFGDGTATASGAEVTHTFERPGNHPVTLTVTNAANEIDTAVLTVPVRNRAAQAGFSWTPDRPWLLDPVRFADESVDPDGSVVAWRWDFGDGESSSEQHPEHQYGRCGVYRVNLMVWDDSGAVSTYTDDVRVAVYPGVPGQEPVCVAPPPKQSASVDGRPTVEVEEAPYYLSGPMGGTLEINGRAWGGEAPLRNVVVTIGEGSGMSTFTRPYDAAGRWRAQFDDFLLPGEYLVEVTAFDENDVASIPVRMTILVL